LPPQLWTAVAAVAAVLAALLAVQVIHLGLLRYGRSWLLLKELAEHAHRPFQVTAAVLAVQLAVRHTTGYVGGSAWRAALVQLLVLVTIAAVAWLVASLLLAMEDAALARFRVDVPDNRHARRIKTQIVMLRRFTIAVIAVLTVAVMLMTFPSVRGIGTSLLASAGLIGAVAALAAQSVLGNVFAGMQLAFSDAVRLDDVVVVEGEWGRIEELTLSYVVVQLWDDRRLILPTSYFTTKPFENWTRTKAAVLGTAELDVDWAIPVQETRDELRRVVEGSDLWDDRVCVLQVTDATGGMVRVRALVSAQDAPSLWDLRCLVRERIVEWVRDQRPIALPRMRAEVGDADSYLSGQWLKPPRGARLPQRDPADNSRVFSGSTDARARNDAFTGPDEPAQPRR
jgi:small-conductance mechanosensitive channel